MNFFNDTPYLNLTTLPLKVFLKDTDKKMSFTEPVHYHSNYELIWCIEGQYEFSILDDNVLLNSNDILFFQKETVHSSKPLTTKASCVVIDFSIDIFPKGIQNSFEKNRIFNHCKYHKIQSSQSLITELYNLFEQERKGSPFDAVQDFKIVELIHHILIVLLNDIQLQCHQVQHFPKDTKYQTRSETFRQLLDYIQINYNTNITLDDLSNHVHFSKNYITQLFRSYVKESPIQYINHYRIKQAIILLENTDLSINEITMEIGFNSTSYFIKYFRESIGLTPKEYRKINCEH